MAYFAEAAVSAALFLLLFHYYRVYQRPFLFLWSLSWATAVVSLVALGLLTWTWRGEGLSRHIFSFLATSAQTFQLIFLLLGSSALTFQTTTSRRQIIIWLILSLVTGALITLPFLWDETAYNQRYILRVGFRYGSMLIAFLVAGYWVGVRYKMPRSIGQKLIAGAFFLFAFYQLYYIAIIFANAQGYELPIPGFFGIIEVMTVSLMGLSMVIYLLEDEHLRLTRSNTELANFLYRTSHDLRSPIATLLSITMMAKRELQDESSLKYLAMIEDRSKKLDSVIGDILHLSRKKHAQVSYDKVDFNWLTKSVFDEIAIQNPDPEVLFNYNSAPDHVLVTDKDFLKTAIFNLVENAVKYRDTTKEKSFINVHFQKSADEVFIEVSDNGQGILAECMPRIFEMFYRANVNIQGTGLGLYIVANLLSKLNGKITATSVYGQYTTFRITLPNLDKGFRDSK